MNLLDSTFPVPFHLLVLRHHLLEVEAAKVGMDSDAEHSLGLRLADDILVQCLAHLRRSQTHNLFAKRGGQGLYCGQGSLSISA